jgi:hypothetical protein
MTALRAIGAEIWYVKGEIALGSDAQDGWTHEVVRQKLKAPDFCGQSLLQSPGDSSATQFAQEKENVAQVRGILMALLLFGTVFDDVLSSAATR